MGRRLMPSILTSLDLSYAQAEGQLTALRQWIAARPNFKERDIVRELKKYDHLCLLISFLGSTGTPSLFKHEFEIQGVFRADFIAGSKATRHFTLIEFEGGETNSLFGPASTNQMRDWGYQLHHALGQIVDWSWALNDAQKSTILSNALGYPEFSRTYVVVCGLDSSMDVTERSRLSWLNDHCTLTDTDVLFMTYNDLILHFEGQLDVYRAALAEARNATPG